MSTTVHPVKRKAFVAQQVKTIAKTDGLIDALVGRYPAGTQVIAGYLDDAGQFWKVNYHWEYLLSAIDHSLTLDISKQHRKCLSAIRTILLVNPPKPQTGYIDKGAHKSRIGVPEDTSSVETVRSRWKHLKQSKKDFHAVVNAANLVGLSPKKKDFFFIAYAVLASPGTSKHHTGYALDIKGDNAKICAISRALGASFVLDEYSHVHVEFAKGIIAAP